MAIYKLGDHIVGHGSSTDEAFVDEVMKYANGEVRCILTDPPYGVAYVEGKKDFNAKMGKEDSTAIQSDHLQSDEDYAAFTVSYLEPIKKHLATYNSAYVFNADTMFPALREGMKTAGWYYSQLVIWIKNTIVIGRKDYLPQHELIAYGWYGRHKFERPKGKSVIFHDKPARSKVHPTMKPVGLLRKLIPNSTKTGEWVYDPFAGSGSTLIACEHLNRRCVSIELDPEYVDTIIKRYEKLTGQKAVTLSDRPYL